MLTITGILVGSIVAESIVFTYLVIKLSSKPRVITTKKPTLQVPEFIEEVRPPLPLKQDKPLDPTFSAFRTLFYHSKHNMGGEV